MEFDDSRQPVTNKLQLKNIGKLSCEIFPQEINFG